MEEARSVEDQVRRMEGLTPGDFAVVVRNQVSLCVNLTAFVAQLKQEIAVKSHGKGRLGFV
jgi:hypothetical protein